MFEIGTGSLLSSNEFIDGKIPRISAKSDNNGILSYYDTLKNANARHFENFISVNFFGTDGGIFYHPYIASIEMKVHTLKIPNYDFNKYTGFFIVGALKQNLKGFDYGSQLSSSKLKNLDLKIQLPTKNGEIDFDFMERFVAEIENEKILKLETYLQENNLNNYHLTQQEKEVLANYEKIKWGKFKMSNLFERIKTKKLPYKAKDLPNQPTSNHTLPCLTSSFNNQGLNYFAPRDGATILKNVVSIPSNSDVYRAYFQSNEFTVLSDAYTIQWILDDVKLPSSQYLFAVQCINQVTDLHIYSYKNKLGGWNVVKNKFIQLPIKNNKPDYEVMETLITAVQKMVIKEVVLYVEKKKKELNKPNLA